jgi:hypothetical protein
VGRERLVGRRVVGPVFGIERVYRHSIFTPPRCLRYPVVFSNELPLSLKFQRCCALQWVGLGIGSALAIFFRPKQRVVPEGLERIDGSHTAGSQPPRPQGEATSESREFSRPTLKKASLRADRLLLVLVLVDARGAVPGIRDVLPIHAMAEPLPALGAGEGFYLGSAASSFCFPGLAVSSSQTPWIERWNLGRNLDLVITDSIVV